MDTSTERAYKRACFQGRGVLARWMDRIFFSLLGGLILLILCGRILPSVLLALAVLLTMVLWDRKRWEKYKLRLWKGKAASLRREAWLKQAAEDIRQAGGVVLYPTPDADHLTGLCLKMGSGAAFHCFGERDKTLMNVAGDLGCSLSFHPWGEGEEPDRKRILERIREEAPRHDRSAWRNLVHLPGTRYVLTGFLLLAFSMCLRRALYWRLLGSLCLLIGGLRWSIQRILER